MNNNNIFSELKRLDFENFLWFIFGILCFLNIYGDNNDKEYLKTKNNLYKTKSNYIFELTLFITLLIYIYFFLRNYKMYEKASINEKELYTFKLLGSSFLIAGIICLIYFQNKQTSFIGSPAI